MAETTGHIGKTLEDLKHQLVSKLAEVKRLLATINALEEFAGLPKTLVQDIAGEPTPLDAAALNEPGVSASLGVSRGSQPSVIRADEYLGEDPLRAAKKYIRRVGHAVHIDEIAEAIKRGNAATKGLDWKERLERGLIRSTADVVKVGEGTFGLTSFYTAEQLKGLRAARQRVSTGDPKRRKGREVSKRPKKTSKRAKGETSGGSEKEPPE